MTGKSTLKNAANWQDITARLWLGNEVKKKKVIPSLMNCEHIGDGWCLDCMQAMIPRSEVADALAVLRTEMASMAVNLPADYWVKKLDAMTAKLGLVKYHAPVGNTENIYDEEIAPQLLAISARCQELGISFVATVEYEPGSLGKTEFQAKDCGVAQLLVHWAARSYGNVDKLFITVDRHARKNGHSSIYLRLFNLSPIGR